MFARYAALVKNLRGVVVFDLSEENVKETIKWLVNRFKYRNLGLPPSLVEKYKEEIKKYLEGKPFKRIVYPVPELRNVASIILEEANIPFELSESLVLASSYISPLLVLGRKFLPFIEKLSVEVVKICKDKTLDVKQWKLHLRIADYTILDFYEESVIEAMNLITRSHVLSKEELDLVLENRFKRIKEDTKRYWRIKCSEGKPFLFYIDMLNVVKDRIKYLSENQAATLSIVPVVHIAP